MKNLLRIGHWEGISFLILLLIAMPLKYIWNWPQAVRMVGSLHGILFVVFIYQLWVARQEKLLTEKQVIIGFTFTASCGTFFLERVWRKSSATN
ncbi:MAG: DUF3817 domain-containing protein [Bacteroidota bacterium]|nr:MAG: DUF3817 domain-containing protein [Bacteroidota bacterium]